jgi:hypothetical protein
MALRIGCVKFGLVAVSSLIDCRGSADAQSQVSWVWKIQHYSVNDSCKRFLHYPTPLLNVAVRAHQSTFPDGSGRPALVFASAHRAGGHSWEYLSLGKMGRCHASHRVPVCLCNSRGHYQPECRHCAHTNRSVGDIQYVSADIEHHLFSDLQDKRSAAVQDWQCCFDRDLRLEHAAFHRSEDLLCSSERASLTA